MKMSRKRLAAIIFVLLIAFLGWFFASGQYKKYFENDPVNDTKSSVQTDQLGLQTVATDLDIPWAIAELPDKDILVTERPGTIKRIGKNQKTFTISGVKHQGEGGLLGLDLHPDFSQNKKIYVYLTTENSGQLKNNVESYTYNDDALSERKVVIGNIPGAANHDGGFIAFGPDKKLYITTGDAGTETNSQDKNSWAGKILRVNDDGSVPGDNPFKNSVYSYGHRNPQGLAWDDQGRLWASEHGRSGLQSGFDEINLIKKGANYGWPEIQGDETRPGMEKPKLHSGANHTWAPGAIAYLNGSLYFTGLKGESLYQAVIHSGEHLSLKTHLRGEYGRLRAVIIGSDGYIYISTSNRDGRGEIKQGDDKIIKVKPGFLK